MNPSLPAPIQPIIENYILLLNKQLPGLINAFYIVGSIALDEFNEQFSDIDFLGVLNQEANPKEIEELRHLTRTKSHPKTATDLSAKPKKKVTPAQLANLKKAWAARSAQAKKERSGKEKEE